MSEGSERAEGSVSAEGDVISNAFQKILENPDIRSTVAAAIGMPAPSKEASADVPASPPGAPNTDALAAIAPLLSSISKKSPSSKISSDQACLLRALKPYVNQSRCEAIDYMIKLSRISELLKNIT